MDVNLLTGIKNKTMEYVFIFGLQIFGIFFNVGQTIVVLDKKNPDKSIREIFNAFFETQWSSMFVSAGILLFHLFTHSIIHYYDMPIRHKSFLLPLFNTEISYLGLSFIIALLFGYGGQELAFRYLNKGKDFLTKKAE